MRREHLSYSKEYAFVDAVQGPGKAMQNSGIALRDYLPQLVWLLSRREYYPHVEFRPILEDWVTYTAGCHIFRVLAWAHTLRLGWKVNGSVHIHFPRTVRFLPIGLIRVY